MSTPLMMDKTLEKNRIKALQKGDVEAFDALFRMYANRLYGFAFSLLKNKDDAEEIVQETFLKIWQKHTTISSDKAFKSYLFTIAHHLIIDQLRIRVKNSDSTTELSEFISTEKSDPLEELNYQLLVERVEKVIGELPLKRRRIYRLSRQLGLSHKEIAAKLEISEKTVENQIGLALKYMRKSLGNEFLQALLAFYLFV
jgi:RNA polymerase sigma-70 factor (ECF subfamily)